MEKLKCKLCDYETDKQIKLSKHTSFKHNLKFSEYLIQVKYNGVHPLCGCGCGLKMKYEANGADFNKFKHGHQSKLEGHWGDPKNPIRVEKIKATRKAKFASGEYDHIKEAIINTRKDPNFGNKISKAVKGIPKPKPDGFGVGRKHSEETREKMSNSAMERIIDHNKQHSSGLEVEFSLILDSLNINYTQWYYVKEIRAFYDFYLPDYNLIIETDGDFYHCNPNKYPNGPVCKTQEVNLVRDKQKNEWVQQNGFKLLRFWETDINTNPQQIIEILKKELNLS